MGRSLTLGAALVAACSAAPLAAQATSRPAPADSADSARARSMLLPGVVVTASRSARPAREVAATVNVMPREVVRTNPARTTDDLLRQMPGVELPRTSSTVSGAEEIVSIRGADEGRTLVLLDGVPLNDPWGEWVQWNRAPRPQLDRVEVLEGGGSSLYGNQAMGGVISMFSRPIARTAYDVTASLGSRGATDLSAYASGVSGPLGYSLSGDYGGGGGYVTLRPDQRGPIDQRSQVFRRNVDGRVEYTSGIGTTFADVNYFTDSRELGTPLTEPNHRSIVGGTLGANLATPGNGTLMARMYAQNQGYLSNSSTVNLARTSEAPLVSQDIPSHDLGGSLQWSRPLGLFETIGAGGDFRMMSGRMNEVVYASGARAGTRTSAGSQEVGGLFAQGVLAPTDPLRIELSARVDGWRSYDGSRVDATTAPSAVTAYHDKTNAAFAPRVGVRYAITPALTVRGSAYQAFRAPTLSEEYRTFYAGPNVFVGNPALTPEHLTGYDAGIDWRPAELFEARATLFWNRYRDLDDFAFQHPGPNPGGITLQRENLGAATANGGEAELALHPVEPLTLSASYDYDHARVLATGAAVNRVPLQRATARIGWDSPLVNASVDAHYEGINHALGGMAMKPYTLLDLDARREVIPGAALFVDVENLLDRQYTANWAGPLEQLGLPRTVRVGISAHSR
jgi:outer membrane cobalamin receptor